jgi:D-arabinose 1-dehydrogenase-like Zn-dependent alcohol dehydrogenase
MFTHHTSLSKCRRGHIAIGPRISRCGQSALAASNPACRAVDAADSEGLHGHRPSAWHRVRVPGGVGTFAIQLAKTVATTTSATNVDLVKSLGADVVIDCRQEDFEKVLSGYDVVLNRL